MSRRVGIFSGTFDPVHEGHIAFALAARNMCKLDSIFLLPERMPRGKEGVTDITHRVAMLRRAIADRAGLETTLLRSNQFTVAETLSEIRTLCGDAELTLLIGSDVVRTFAYRWDGLGELFKTMQLVICMRRNDRPEDIKTTLGQLAHEYKVPIRYNLLPSQYPRVSSSVLRSGANASGLHEPVAAYIKLHNLYVV